MGIGEVLALGGVILGLFGSVGATVRWVVVQYRALNDERAKLYREQTLTLVMLEHWRTAVRMLSLELYRVSPGNAVLLSVGAMLEKSFPLEPGIPPDMAEMLRRANGGKDG